MRALSTALILIALALPAPAQTEVPESRAEIALSFAPVVKKAAPAVVNIYASRIVAQRLSPFAGDPFFSQLFDFGQTVPRVQNSLGSGVILSPDGIVVSNYHVVGGAEDIRVVLTDRREFSGRVILADEAADLAVIQLDGAKGLPALELAKADQAEVGDLVLAIGNPVRRRPDSHLGHHLGPCAPRRRDGAWAGLFHPDRCRDQSRQFRRRAGECRGAAIGLASTPRS